MSQLNRQRDINEPLRVVIQQPALPKYRIPAFRALAARPGIDLHVVYSRRAEVTSVPAEGFRATYVPEWRKTLMGHPLYWHRAQLASNHPPDTDVLVLSGDLHYLSLLPALLQARLRGIATVFWGHGYSKSDSRLRRWLRNRVARLATAVMLYNHGTARTFIEAGWDPRRVHVALNCLDQSPIQDTRRRWLADPNRLADFRRQQQLDPGPNLLFVSRLDPSNRLDLLIRAAQILAPRHPGLNVIIIGSGEDHSACQQLVTRLGLGRSVRCLGAIYDEMELAPWFLCADVFVYPANIGLSLLHAFGYGLPVVTSDLVRAQNPEIEALENGVNGLLYRHGDPAALADAVECIIRDPQLRRRMSEAAMETVSQRFALQNMVDGMEGAMRYCAEQSTHYARRRETSCPDGARRAAGAGYHC